MQLVRVRVKVRRVDKLSGILPRIYHCCWICVRDFALNLETYVLSAFEHYHAVSNGESYAACHYILLDQNQR